MVEVADSLAMAQTLLEQSALPHSTWPQSSMTQMADSATMQPQMEHYAVPQVQMVQSAVQDLLAMHQSDSQVPVAQPDLATFTYGQTTGLPSEVMQSAMTTAPSFQFPQVMTQPEMTQQLLTHPDMTQSFLPQSDMAQPSFPQFPQIGTQPVAQLSSSVLLQTDLSAFSYIKPGAYSGIVKSFNPMKGFGFINSSGIEGDVFFMKTDLQAELRNEEASAQGRSVMFELKTGTDGRARATNVQMLPMEGQPVLGVIKSYSEKNAYGFISATSLSRDVHFKQTDLPPAFFGLGSNLVGKTVSFQVQALQDGKLKALQLEVKGGQEMLGQAPACDAAKQLRGFVKSYDATQGVGILQAPGVADDVQFWERVGFPLVPNQEVGFSLQWLPDGSPQATNITVGIAPTGSSTQLYNGAKLVGTVKSFNDQKGFGFINVAGQQVDLYFQKKDLTSDTQQQVMQGVNITGAMVNFLLEALPDGRWHARTIKLAQTPTWQVPSTCSFVEGVEMTGTVKSFNEKNGYGFITVPNQAGDIYFQPIDFTYETQQELQNQPSGNIDAGTRVHFWLQQLPGGRWRAREVRIAEAVQNNVGEMANSIAIPNLAGSSLPGLSYNSNTLVEGVELSGTVKSYNQSKGYGFINVAGNPVDLYFQTRDLTPETQQQLQVGVNLIGGSVFFWLEALLDGRCGKWRARDVRLAQAEALLGNTSLLGIAEKRPFMGDDATDENPLKQRKVEVTAGDTIYQLGAASGIAQELVSDWSTVPGNAPAPRLSGTVKSFNAAKGFGFMTSAGLPGDIFFLKSELPVGFQDGEVEAGRALSFELGLAPDGKLRGNNITFDG